MRRPIGNSSSMTGKVDVSKMVNSDTSSVEPKVRRWTEKQKQRIGVNLIIEGAKLLDWTIAFSKRGKYVRYAIVGESKAVDRLLGRLK